MKKNLFYALGLTLSLSVAISCVQGNLDTQDNKRNPVEATAQWLSNPDTKGDPVIGIRTRVGHTKENCDQSCTKKGSNIHISCQGRGSECSMVGNIKMEPIVKAMTTQPTLTGICLYPEDISDEETFAMPSRSFKIDNTEQWLNIPEQILHRHPESHCFIIKSITFTDSPLYLNL
ncbi:MAG: hypothetical protein IAB08_05305 [Bacteroidetes bacterium]|uniref:Lipoprotein n=1 Tax=Candidatus Pullibacteroides excrementavium TaxID=2840905 RepID=A0A9D9DUK0_9BACT|nr:hypothetical protein [Candidatus Pullibacteroides excrementavium]